MTFLQAGGQEIPATIVGRTRDEDWGGRESKAITCRMPFDQARELFVDGLEWGILYRPEGGTEDELYDNSDFSIAGPLTDNRDGTVTAKMGKFTNEELLLMEVLG